VDLNRNWDDHWCQGGASRIPSSETYCGTAPFSEPESAALAKVISEEGPFAAYLDIHSYSELVLRPYGWTTAPPPNEPRSKAVGDAIRDAINSVYGKVYVSQPSIALYVTTGTSTDWAYIQASIPFSYCIESRDKGQFGFLLPPAQILQTGVETYAGVKELARAAIAG